MQVPRNVGTDQQTQVSGSHLVILAVLADLLYVRQEIEKGLPGNIFNK